MVITKFYLHKGDFVHIESPIEVTAFIINDLHLEQYSNSELVDYYGGYFNHLPAIIEIPYDGTWNIVVSRFDGEATLYLNEIHCSVM